MIRILVLVAVLIAVAAPSVAGTVIQGIRTGESAGGVRVVVDLTQKPKWRLFVLESPYRVVIDIEGATWSPNFGADPPRGLIRSLRHGAFSDDIARIVLEFAKPAIAAKQFVLSPRPGHGYRLVVDLHAVDDQQFAAARAATRKAVPAPSKAPVAPPVRDEKLRVVVIDPGHGGVDPGAIGRGRGVREKDIVLAVGLRLRNALKAKGGYQVIMTRSTDRFIPLRKRVSIAENAGAKLFVSLHADSASKRSVRGAGVYTLSEKASDAEAAALARRENRSDIVAGVELAHEADPETKDILRDLLQRNTKNESARFAEVVVSEIGRTISLRGNPHRFAGFRVLRAPRVPSVLIELGFLSNNKEEQKLRSKEWQNRVSIALADAIDAFFKDKRKAARRP